MAEIGFNRKGIVQGSTLGLGILLATALLALVNYFGWKYHKRFDWTEAQLYSLSEQSVNVARSLDRDVEMILLTSPESPLLDSVREILARYEAASPRIRVREMDPMKNLVEAQRLLEQYETRFDPGTVKVVLDAGEGRRRVFGESDLAEFDYSSVQFGGQPGVETFKGEEVLTGALVDLAEGEKPRVLLTTGHGEKRKDDASGAGLQGLAHLLGENVEVEEWASLGKPDVPEGTDLVIVAGPTTPFVEPELQAFSRYLDRGGRMLWLLDPTLAPGGGLVDLGLGEWLRGYGADLGDDVVFDPDQAMPFFGAQTFFVQDYGDHPVTRALRQVEAPVLLALARSVGESDGVPAGLEVTELLETDASGWGERSLDDLGAELAPDDADLQGPVPLAVAVETVAEAEEDAAQEDLSSERPGDAAGEMDSGADEEAVTPEAGNELGEDAPDSADEGTTADAAAGSGDTTAAAESGDAAAAGSGETAGDSAGEETAGSGAVPEPASRGMRLLVVGDSEFASDSQLGNAGNGVLLDNALNWLLARETLLGIPPKKPEQTRLILTGDQLLRIYLLTALLPLAAIVAGVAVYVRRRR